ncbi:hypothetical protein E4T56_gene8076 [Termitomyces sp. T112]|nr:hypothetical protein E4T56_gene8076 [Termitomyces sp. T112]
MSEGNSVILPPLSCANKSTVLSALLYRYLVLERPIDDVDTKESNLLNLLSDRAKHNQVFIFLLNNA